MASFTFYNPTRLIFGKDTIKEIGPSIKKDGAKKVLMIAGGGSIKKNGVYDAVVRSLEKSGIKWVEVWGVRANPVLQKANECIWTARENSVDAVLAVGGGSVIDTAKTVAAGFYLENIWEAYEHKVEIEKALPVYTVLTISAAGSEMDQYAVLTNENSLRKWNIMSEALYPKASVIDPSVQETLPWRQTVNGALDALAHIMEYYFLGEGEETVMAMDESLMRSIVKAVDRLQSAPGDYEARADLAWAATLALNGISGAGLRGGDWASHWIEHAVSALFPQVAHGAGLGVIFPAWIECVSDASPAVFQRWAKNVWGSKDVYEALEKFRDKVCKWGNPASLGELGIKEEDLPGIASKAMEVKEVGVLKPLKEKDIVTLIKKAL